MLEPVVLPGLCALITLPVLAPIVALLQLLFPSLMRTQYEQYKTVIHVLLTQSSVMFVHWGLVTWIFTERRWWLSDEALGGVLLAIAVVGALTAFYRRTTSWKQAGDPTAAKPATMEFLTLGLFVGLGLGWAVYQARIGASIFDPLFVLTIGCVVAVGHLLWRAAAGSKIRPRFVSTELMLLSGIVCSGVAVAAYSQSASPQRIAAEITRDWPTYRGSPERTCSWGDAALSAKPRILWQVDLQEKKGRVRLHSTPTVVDGVLFIGGMHQVLTFTQGLMYCVSTEADATRKLQAGEVLWKFSDGGNLKPVFSSPSIVGGKVFFGEGYHQDTKCRLFCLDGRRGDQPLWTFTTTSHVESPPTIVDGRVYFGAGDDGLFAFDVTDGTKPLWQVRGAHVDSSPLVVDGKVIVGSVLGDIQKDFVILAVDAKDGREAWRLPAPFPVPGAPAYADGRVYVSLGKGKMDHDAEEPAGAVWCLEAKSGHKHWEFPLPNGVLNSPVVAGDLLLFGCRDGFCYALDRASGDLKWKQDLGEPIVSAPAVNGEHAVFVTIGGLVVCLDVRQGAEQWRLEELRTEADNDCFAGPTSAAGRLYIAVGNKVFCLGTE